MGNAHESVSAAVRSLPGIKELDPVVAERIGFERKFLQHIDWDRLEAYADAPSAIFVEMYEKPAARQQAEIDSFNSEEEHLIPEGMDFSKIDGLSDEGKDLLARIRPRSLVRLPVSLRTPFTVLILWLFLCSHQGAAKRIEGMTPVAILLIMSAIAKESANLASTNSSSRNRRSRFGPPPSASPPQARLLHSSSLNKPPTSTTSRSFSTSTLRPTASLLTHASPLCARRYATEAEVVEPEIILEDASEQKPERVELDPMPPAGVTQIRGWLTVHLKDVLETGRLADKLVEFGIEKSEAEALAQDFGREVLPELEEQSEDRWEALWNMESIQYDSLALEAQDRRTTGSNLPLVSIVHRLLAWSSSQSRFLRSPSSSNASPSSPSSPYLDAIDHLSRLAAIGDYRYPADRFPQARARQRTIHLHVGPTNSGKTYNAMVALVNSSRGTFAGPLRLLAHEIWERTNRGSVGGLKEGQGRACNLLTGEEVRIVSEDAPLSSATVEMVSRSSAELEVAVFDEIQMIADRDRGGGWTDALLCSGARNIHLCGEATVVGLVTRMMEELGDKVVVNNYQRLSGLKVAEKSLKGDWKGVEKGDCVIAWSRKQVFALKTQIEEATGLRCAVAYGALPPETRADQAKLFNDPESGYDVIIATDAIGMGLNL
jgi:hypothetical protein